MISSKKLKKNIFRIAGVAIICIIIFSMHYTWRYSMDIAPQVKLGIDNAEFKVLIGTQKSEYKDEVMSHIFDAFKNDASIFIKSIDVGQLYTEDPTSYNAIIIIHTIEMWSAPKSVLNFVNSLNNEDLFTLSTSGEGIYNIEGVDGITSASILLDSKQDANSVIDWLRNKKI